MVVVIIPTALRGLTNGADRVEADGTTIRRLIADLDRQYPGFQARVLEEDALAAGLSVAVDGNLVSRGLWEPVPDGAEVAFVPAISGGTFRDPQNRS